jgi:hypothetical protein
LLKNIYNEFPPAISPYCHFQLIFMNDLTPSRLFYRVNRVNPIKTFFKTLKSRHNFKSVIKHLIYYLTCGEKVTLFWATGFSVIFIWCIKIYRENLVCKLLRNPVYSYCYLIFFARNHESYNFRFAQKIDLPAVVYEKIATIEKCSISLYTPYKVNAYFCLHCD